MLVLSRRANKKILFPIINISDEFDLLRGPGGVDRWFRKPVDPLSLVRDVKQALDKS